MKEATCSSWRKSNKCCNIVVVFMLLFGCCGLLLGSGCRVRSKRQQARKSKEKKGALCKLM
jgi:hypothetical protein